MDFKPDNSNEVLQNVVVRNSIINSNSRSGIEFLLGHLTNNNTSYPMPGSSLQNLTIVGNGSTNVNDESAGLVIDKYLTGLTMKNCLIGGNALGRRHRPFSRPQNPYTTLFTSTPRPMW